MKELIVNIYEDLQVIQWVVMNDKCNNPQKKLFDIFSVLLHKLIYISHSANTTCFVYICYAQYFAEIELWDFKNIFNVKISFLHKIFEMETILLKKLGNFSFKN